MAVTTATDVARHLERHLREQGCQSLLYYGDLVAEFEDLPPLNGAWSSHPLCQLFDELDREDAAMGRPFRTALVVSRKENLPGKGFFEAYAKYANKGKRIASGDRTVVHAAQLKALAALYAK